MHQLITIIIATKVTQSFLSYSATSLRCRVRGHSPVFSSGILQNATVASQRNQKTCSAILTHFTHFTYYIPALCHDCVILWYRLYIPTAWVDASRRKKCVRRPLRASAKPVYACKMEVL